MAQISGFFSVSPAPAGMIQEVVAKLGGLDCEPRTRGDDPKLKKQYDNEPS